MTLLKKKDSLECVCEAHVAAVCQCDLLYGFARLFQYSDATQASCKETNKLTKAVLIIPPSGLAFVRLHDNRMISQLKILTVSMDES